MRVLHLILFFLLTVSVTPLHGQSLERWLIGSAGHLRTSPTIHLSGTSGESVIGYSENTNLSISIGFQQGNTGPVGISEVYDKYSLKVYPVPAIEELMVEMSFTEVEDITLSIFSITGSKLFYTEEEKGSSHIKKGIDISNLPAGNYLIHINISGKETISIKIQKIN